MEIPVKLTEYLTERQLNENSPCEICNSSCCNGPGFAIFENVTKIYERYSKGTLARSDYEFEKNLSLSQFIFRYFDRAVINERLLVFFPKVIMDDNKLISVPPWNFWESRKYLFKRTKSCGCIFLNKKQESKDLSVNGCILHNEKYKSEITEKPIDCLFLYCNGLRNVINPSQTETNLWFSLLDHSFQNSSERFNEMFPELME
jgi:hypothetical protein